LIDWFIPSFNNIKIHAHNMKVFDIAAFTAVAIILSIPAALKHLRSHWLKESIERIETTQAITRQGIQLVEKIADSLHRLENILVVPTNTSPCESSDPLEVEACRIQTNRLDLQRTIVEMRQYGTQIHENPGSAIPNARPKSSSDIQVPRWVSE
jgi:hypothetical protein